MKNKYKIAGLVVSMESFGTTQTQAIPYLCDNEQIEDISIESNREVIINNHPEVSENLAEYLSTGASFYLQLLNYNGLMLHSSAVVVDERAYLFTANSGTGKSTHTKLWLRYFNDRSYILNDDKPALRLIDGKWYAFGTPWSGKDDLSVNTGVELAGIAVLERSEKNEIEPYQGKQAIFEIFSQVNRPNTYAYREKLMTLLEKLIADVPIWKLKCNMDLEAAIISYETMSGKNREER